MTMCERSCALPSVCLCVRVCEGVSRGNRPDENAEVDLFRVNTEVLRNILPSTQIQLK